MRPALFAVACLCPFSSMSAEKPFDFASTPGKLPKGAVPTDYVIHIVTDPDKLTFTGEETIKLEARAPIKELVFNSANLEIAKAAINDKNIPKSAIKLDNDQELARVALPDGLPKGEHKLVLNFSGKINGNGRGLYYADYQEQGTGIKKRMLGSQFEATDARQLFPCWDEPVFRARFQLTVVVPQNWTAISNMPIEKETTVAGGKEIRFGASPAMSSYLNVLVAGELDLIEMQSHGVQSRVVATKGKAAWGGYALESTDQILGYFNEYFGVPYPLPKLDQIAVPGGFGGAMENWGGITYYESKLLFDPEKSSQATKQDIYEVIAHEVAHQWFGDLVTMAWWDNLWLNEGFASWMGSKCSAKFNPQWEVWLRRNTPRNPTRRAGISKEQAMEGDARSTTHPIQQPVKTEAEANSAFDDITYRKGEAFIRMLENFLGEDLFRDGIRRYVKKHKLSNTTTADLWAALSEASGKPVTEIAAAWTEQPGFPLVLVKREKNNSVSLRQERFAINFPNAPALTWKIPLTYKLRGDEQPSSRVMSGKVDILQNVPAGSALKVNVNGAGLYRVDYDEISWKLLLDALPQLSVADRVNLLSDTWALVQANRAPFTKYIDLIKKLPSQTELAEREQIIHVFGFFNRLLAGQQERTLLQTLARGLLRPCFDQLGWDARPDEPVANASLRASLVELLGELGDKELVGNARERFQKYLTEPASLPPDLRGPVFAVVARAGDSAVWNRLHELGVKTTSIEEKEYFYDALANATDPKLVQATLQISLTDELPSSRAIYLVGKVARDSDHPELAWEFAKANMKELLAKTDALGENSYVPSLFTFFSDLSRVEELKNYAKSHLPPASAPEVKKAVDEIQFRSDLKARMAKHFAASPTISN